MEHHNDGHDGATSFGVRDGGVIVLEQVASLLSAFRKMAPLPLLAIALATAVLLFSPDALARTLGIAEFVDQYRWIIGLLFIGASCYLLAHLICWVGGRAVAAYDSRRKTKIRQSHLRELTPEEKSYLLPYIFDDCNTQYFGFDDGVAGGLAGKGVLYRASTLVELDRIPYNILPWARRYLKEHPEILEGAQRLPPKQDDGW